MGGREILKHWRLVFIAILIILGAIYRKEAENIARIVVSAPLWLFLVAFASVFIEFCLQALRMYLVFKKGFGETLRAYAVGHFVAFSFPSRTLGEGARIGALARELGVKTTEMAAYVSVERLMDMLVIATAAAGILYTISLPAAILVAFAIVGGFSLFLLNAIPKKAKSRLPLAVREYIDHGQKILRKKRLSVTLLVITALLWAIDFFRMWIILWGMGARIPYPAVAALVSLAYILAVLSFLPGGLGAYESGLIGGLVLKGVSVDIATAATLYERFFSYWLWIIVGALAGASGKGK